MVDFDKSKLKEDIKRGGYDIGVQDEPNSSQPPSSPPHNSDSDGVKEGDDLSNKTKKTLGQYISSITNKNYYSISDNDKTISTTTQNDKPASLDKSPNSGNIFGVPQSSISHNFSITNAGNSSNQSSLSTILKKGNSDKPSNIDGNNLLSNNVEVIKEKYTSAIIQTNRFNTGKLYHQNTREPSDIDRDLSYYGRDGIKDTLVTNEFEKISDKKIPIDSMRKVGQVLMLRATGEIESNNRNYNPNANIGALLPGASQILPTQIIDSKNLEARDVMEAMMNEEIGSKTPGPDVKSWGALNNQLEPFTGILPAGMIALCIALILAVKLSFEVLGLLLSLVTDKPKYPYNSIGIHFKGKYRSESIDSNDKGLFGGLSIGGIKDLNTLLGLRDTSYKYDDCFKRGIEIFFGTQGSSNQGIVANIAASAASSFKLALESPGYYVVFCRSIIRSGYGIGKKLSELGSNPLSIVQGVLNIIDDLRSSKIIAAYNMFAQIGDTSLRDEDNQKTILNQDAIPNDAPAVVKNRYSNSKILAWRSTSAPSLYVLPQNYINNTLVANKSNNVNGIGPLWDASSNFIESAKDEFKKSTNIYQTDTLKNKIPSDIVKALENKLEAEYVPFYFQDSRTNEIISFHAFLESLNEDYSVNWDSTEAYGRVDQIKIYKNTSRKISLSFRVIAADASDFESMWFKINKLITMVYPQWSKGKRIQPPGENYDFAQPFSQLISSSPILRLRIGDLIRSNYSKFSLIRIFDLQKIDDKSKKISLKNKVNEITKTINDFYSGKADEKTLSTLKKAIQDKTLTARINSNSPCIANPAKANGGLAGAASKLASSVGLSSNDEKEGIEYLDGNQDIKTIVSVDTSMIVVELVNGKKYGVPIGSSIIFNWNNNNWSKLISGAENNIDDLSKSATNFFGDTNPIVKYFEDNTFRGLACTIDNLSFEWLNQNQWQVLEPGSQAPKSCLINMSFTPIHDIAPGLDSNGFNRAPIYRVGKQIEAITNPNEMRDVVRPIMKPIQSKGKK